MGKEMGNVVGCGCLRSKFFWQMRGCFDLFSYFCKNLANNGRQSATTT